MWPVFLAINEIKYKARFRLENVLLGNKRLLTIHMLNIYFNIFTTGILPGPKKPKIKGMYSFLETCVVKQLNELKNGN